MGLLDALDTLDMAVYKCKQRQIDMLDVPAEVDVLYSYMSRSR